MKPSPIYAKHPLRKKRNQGPVTEEAERLRGPEGVLAEASEVLKHIEEGTLAPGLSTEGPPIDGTDATDPTDPTDPTPTSALGPHTPLGRVGKTLTAEQEKILAYRVQTFGDVDARNLLVEKNLRLAHLFVGGFSKSASPEMKTEYTQEAMLGLIRAAETFDPRFDKRFSTFAMHWIRAAVGRLRQRLQRDDSPLVSVSRRAMADGYEVDVHTKKKVRRRNPVTKIDAPYTSHADDEASTFGDTLSDQDARLPDAEVERRQVTDFVREVLFNVLREFENTPLEGVARDIVFERLLADDGKGAANVTATETSSLEAIGAKHGYSREYVRVIERRIRESARTLISGRSR